MNYSCEYCNKNFTSKHRYKQHLDICISKYKKTINELKEQLEELKVKDDIILKLQIENKILKENIPIHMETRQMLMYLQDKLKEITEIAIEQKTI